MGGVTKALDPTGNNFLGAGKTIGRIAGAGLTGGLSEFGRSNPFGVPFNPLVGNYGQSDKPPIPGPFSLDQNQFDADRAAINQTGQQQFDATNAFVNQDQATRAGGRAALAQALTKQGQDVFQQGLPATLEDLNARKLLNGSGVGQEIGRQQANLATNIADQVGTLGAGDIDLASQQRAAALSGRQGFETGALQRGLSLEDQINNANISKTIGQVFAPQPPSGKQNFGAAAQGVGALAPLLKLGK